MPSNIDRFLKRSHPFDLIVTVVVPYSSVKARKIQLPLGHGRGSEHTWCADGDAELRDLSLGISSGPARLQWSLTQRCHPPFLARVKGSSRAPRCYTQYFWQDISSFNAQAVKAVVSSKQALFPLKSLYNHQFCFPHLPEAAHMKTIHWRIEQVKYQGPDFIFHLYLFSFFPPPYIGEQERTFIIRCVIICLTFNIK